MLGVTLNRVVGGRRGTGKLRSIAVSTKLLQPDRNLKPRALNTEWYRIPLSNHKKQKPCISF